MLRFSRPVGDTRVCWLCSVLLKWVAILITVFVLGKIGLRQMGLLDVAARALENDGDAQNDLSQLTEDELRALLHAKH